MDPPLMGSEIIPKYEFVQDIEEIPDVIIQEPHVIGQALVIGPVDSFWFFQLEKTEQWPRPNWMPPEDNSLANQIGQSNQNNLVEISHPTILGATSLSPEDIPLPEEAPPIGECTCKILPVPKCSDQGYLGLAIIIAL